MVDRFSGAHRPNDKDHSDREARVAYVLSRALSLSDELKSTVLELTEMLRSESTEEESDHSE